MYESKPSMPESVSPQTLTPGQASNTTATRRSATVPSSSSSPNLSLPTSHPPSHPTIPTPSWSSSSSRSSASYRSSPLSQESPFQGYSTTPNRPPKPFPHPKPFASSPKLITQEMHASFNLQMKTLEQYLLKCNSGFPVTAPIQGIFKLKNTDPEGYKELCERLALKDRVHCLLVKQASERWALVEKIRGDLDKYCNGPAR